MERKFKYSLNTNIINKPEKPTAPGWINVETTANELVNYVKQGFCFSHAVIKDEKKGGSKPKKEHVLYAELLGVDIDNDILGDDGKKRCLTLKEGYIPFEVAINSTWIRENALFAYTSYNSAPEWNRYRIIFALPSQFTQAEYEELAKKLIPLLRADPSCCNFERIWYGNDAAEVEIFGKTLSRDTINLVYDEEKKAARAKKELSKYRGEVTPELAAEMLKHVPKQFNDNWDWARIVYSVASHFQKDTAIRLVNDWSPDVKQGTDYKVDWYQAYGRGDITIGTLIGVAMDYGFKFKPELSETKVGPRGKLSRNIGGDGGKEDGGKAPGKKGAKQSVILAQMEEFLYERYDFRFDIIRTRAEWKPKGAPDYEYKDLEDQKRNAMYLDMTRNDIEAKDDLLRKILNGGIPEYHPFQNYFFNLPEWDGEDHIGKVIDVVPVAEEDKRRWRQYFYVWIVGVVAQSIEWMTDDEYYQNQQCLLFQGGQGVGKTTFFRRLVPKELKKYYAECKILSVDKDADIRVAQKFITNLDESEGTTGTAMTHLKSLISSDERSVRKPYAENENNYRRHTSFCGSVNDEQFISDLTGSRRFLLIKPIDKFSNHEFGRSIDLRQMYAQALYGLRRNLAKLYFEYDEIAMIDAGNKSSIMVLEEEEWIEELFTPYDATGKDDDEIKRDKDAEKYIFLTATGVKNAIEIAAKKTFKATPATMGKILKRLKFKRINEYNEKAKKQAWGYRCIKVSSVDGSPF